VVKGKRRGKLGDDETKEERGRKGREGVACTGSQIGLQKNTHPWGGDEIGLGV